MLRRSPRSPTTLDQTRQELARQESELHDQMQKLERMIAEAPRVAQEAEKRQREELLMRASQGGSRLDVSLTLHDKRYGGGVEASRPRGALRKERREGRIVFIVLVVAVLSAVIWLLNHLYF